MALKCLVFNWASHLELLYSTAHAANMAGEGFALWRSRQAREDPAVQPPGRLSNTNSNGEIFASGVPILASSHFHR